ncbi:MAG: acyl-CoA synthetase [Caulobacteraceae bacterium]|nr:acyl-CoA synthetase [Caulobacteraceae bacterium]
MHSDNAPIADAAHARSVTTSGWPLDIPGSVHDGLARAAARFGPNRALTFLMEADQKRAPHTWSFDAYLEEVMAAANAFHRLGIGRRDVVALVLPNAPETFFCLWGAQTAGIVFPINPLLEAGGIADLLRASQAKVVVTVGPIPKSDLYQKVTAAIAGAPSVEHLVTVDLARYLRGMKAVFARVAAGRIRRSSPALRYGVAETDYRKLVSRMRTDVLEIETPAVAADTASLFGTGGSTGAPKLARRTHGNEIANAWMSNRMLGEAFAPGTVILAGLPLFHCNGAMATGLSPFLNGGEVLLTTPQGYRGKGVISGFWRLIERYRVNVFSGVPTVFSTLLQIPIDGADISSLKCAFCGSAPMSATLIDQFEAATGVVILEGYGLTEATCVVALNPAVGERKPGSVGLPLPFQQARVALVDDEENWIRDAVPGETGVVVLSGPNVFQGYVSEHHNQGLWLTDEQGQRWLNTGDLGTFDEAGYLWLKGRSKDIIIRGGHNIDPAMIEDVFYAHPAVALAAAVGRADAHAGEVPVVFVELKPGAQADPASLMAFAEPRIMERAARPKSVEIIAAMPVTAVGKVHKPTLRALLAAQTPQARP